MASDQGYVPISDGGRLFYRVVGSGSDAVVIPPLSYLVDDLEPLARKRRLIFYDPRGRGGSDAVGDESLIWSDYEIDDLEAVRQHFALEKISLIGWSYFGGVTALYTMKYPERVNRLVLMGSIPPRQPAPYVNFEEQRRKWESRIDPQGVKRLEEMKESGVESEDPEGYCREHNRVYLPAMMGRPERLAKMRSDPCIFPNEWPRNAEEHRRKHFPPESWEHDWLSRLSSLKTPTLVIHGTEDLIPLESSREWATTLSHARLLIIEGSGHYLHLEAPEVYFPAVERFLSGEWPEEAVEVT